MRIFADRFLLDDDSAEAVDLATRDTVQLAIEPPPPRDEARARADLCDRLAALRHPLLLPLLDYGIAEGRWFEARAALAPLGAPKAQLRRTALHLVRFLRASGIEPTRSLTERAVRAAVETGGGTWRPIGIRLCAPPALEVIDAALHGGGPPGVTRVTIGGPPGSGLRTLRVQAARVARLAGYVVLDRQLAARCPPVDPPRHYCVLDWLRGRDEVPPVLADAALRGARRHVWLRFARGTAGASVGPQRLTPTELIQMVFADTELGPTMEELRAGACRADGLPGPYLETLARGECARGRGTLWVHETTPAYVAQPEPAAAPAAPGVARLLRVVESARALIARGRHARAERLLRRACSALRARGAADAAAEAACALAGALASRGRASQALDVLENVRSWTASPAHMDAVLLESARAMRDLDRFADAEGACRTVLAGAPSNGARDHATVLLAEVLGERGDTGAGEALLTADITSRDGCAAALGARLALAAADVRRASELAQHAVLLSHGAGPDALCAANAAAMCVQAALSNRDGFERHARAALAAARAARSRVLRWTVGAEAFALGRRTGVSIGGYAPGRMRAAAALLPPYPARRIRAALDPADAESSPPRPGALDTFERLLALAYEAPDEARAAAAVAAELAQALGASCVSIRGSARQQLAAAGRPWGGDGTLADLVLNAGAGILRDGAVTEAAEPVKIGGSTIGCVAARWVAASPPRAPAVREWLRMAGAALAPAVSALNAPPPDPPAAGYPDDLLGPGPAAGRVRELLRRAAQAPYAVLVEGESGSGKELVARAIHARSARRARRFCAVNCAALTEDLLEAELFGHVRGAFTGAIGERQGLFEEADQGTLFLDEVAELSPRAQAKLLRVLQDGEVRRVGENLPRRIDVRIVAATNRPLVAEVERGRFRADLRFRLDVIRIVLPPLRERPDEIPWLAERIWAEAAARVGTRAVLSPELLAALARYDWPGNVRELQNVLAAVAVHAPKRGRVTASLLPPQVAQLAGRAPSTFDAARVEFECRFVRAALARAGGRRGAAARQLGVSRQGLAKMMKRLGIEGD